MTHANNDIVSHRGNAVEITAVYDDDTADVQRVDGKGAVVLDANNQPQWTPRVPFAELVAHANKVATSGASSPAPEA